MSGIIITQSDFSTDIISNIDTVPIPRGNCAEKYRKLYKNVVCAFDIETTALPEISQSIMYIWQFQIGKDITVIGRTWEEFLEFLQKLLTTVSGKEYYVIYVHNLSYEFQFLSGIYQFLPQEVFAVKSRKVLKATMFSHFEFRCSYLHSNMSLEKFLNAVGAQTQKESGELYNYSKKRYPWTPLTDREIKYCVADVKGLVEAIYIELDKDGDTLYTIPLTSTGYVRRDFRNAMKEVGYDYIDNIYPDYDLYVMLREAFRGGDTHANRYYSGYILKNVKSADRSSSYPDTQVNEQYPIAEFKKLENVSRETLERKIYKRGLPICFRAKFTNIHLKDHYWPDPYLSKSKCRNIVNSKLDNGRILEADMLETTLTDIDYRIINDTYDYDIEIFDCYQSKYGQLPKQAINLINKLYHDKTSLKGVEEQDYYYMKSKNKINSVYGMTAQDPVKITDIFNGQEFQKEILNFEQEVVINYEKQLLEKSRKKAFIPYFWGVWCTALARYELYKGIRNVYDQDGEPVYWDTDSVKYMNDVSWEKYNDCRIAKSRAHGAHAKDIKGIDHYMGVFEQENTYTQFCTLGAKKYVYTYGSDLHITIAGVPKKKGALELTKKGGIEAFKPGFIFCESGKLESVYNDKNYGKYEIDGRHINITRNIYLRDTTYEVSLSDDYGELLDEINYEKALTNMHKSGKI